MPFLRYRTLVLCVRFLFTLISQLNCYQRAKNSPGGLKKRERTELSKINKEDDRAFIVEEYKRDIEFYETVLQKQWEEMWREWELRYSEWEAENQL